MEKIDLHLHTNVSDGDLSAEELIKRSISVGCSKIAITDHDKIDDYSKLSQLYDVHIINGIEFNCLTKGMHILGYGIENIDNVKNIMNNLEKENERVCFQVIDALYQYGYDISVENVLDYMYRIGFKVDTLNKKHIVKYLIYKEYVRNVLEAYDHLIGVGTKFYYPIRKLSKEEIINIIKTNGGVSVLAHPSTLKLKEKQLEEEVRTLINLGLDGMEIKNRSITNAQSIIYENMANKLNLIKTVGSDFHSPYQDIIGVETSEEVYENLQKQIQLRKKYDIIK